MPENEKLSGQFLGMLKPIKGTLLKDAEFILESDPAAKSLEEVIAIYPGFFATYCYQDCPCP